MKQHTIKNLMLTISDLPLHCFKLPKQSQMISFLIPSRRPLFQIRLISNIHDSKQNFKSLEFTLRNPYNLCCLFRTPLFSNILLLRKFFPVLWRKYYPLIQIFLKKWVKKKTNKVKILIFLIFLIKYLTRSKYQLTRKLLFNFYAAFSLLRTEEYMVLAALANRLSCPFPL